MVRTATHAVVVYLFFIQNTRCAIIIFGMLYDERTRNFIASRLCFYKNFFLKLFTSKSRTTPLPPKKKTQGQNCCTRYPTIQTIYYKDQLHLYIFFLSCTTNNNYAFILVQIKKNYGTLSAVHIYTFCVTRGIHVYLQKHISNASNYNGIIFVREDYSFFKNRLNKYRIEKAVVQYIQFGVCIRLKFSTKYRKLTKIGPTTVVQNKQKPNIMRISSFSLYT